VNWGNIVAIVAAMLVAVGLPLALRSRKKGGQKKVEELCQHLQRIGVEASALEEGTSQEKPAQKRSWGEKSVGIIKLTDKNIDSISVIGVASQYGANYFLDYLVTSPSLIVGNKKKKTRMSMKKSSLLRGEAIDIEWKGDNSLAQKLNLDYRLKDKLLQADLSTLKGSIQIIPESKYGYVRIRTTYLLPSPDVFDSMDIIAKHISSGW